MLNKWPGLALVFVLISITTLTAFYGDFFGGITGNAISRSVGVEVVSYIHEAGGYEIFYLNNQTTNGETVVSIKVDGRVEGPGDATISLHDEEGNIYLIYTSVITPSTNLITGMAVGAKSGSEEKKVKCDAVLVREDRLPDIQNSINPEMVVKPEEIMDLLLKDVDPKKFGPGMIKHFTDSCEDSCHLPGINGKIKFDVEIDPSTVLVIDKISFMTHTE